MKKRFLTGVVLVLCAAIVFVSLASHAVAEPIRVGVFPNLHCALISLADNQGLFKKHGLDIVIKLEESGLVSLTDLIEDKIDIAPTAEFAFVVQVFKHPDMRIAATIYNGSDHDFVVRKDRGIAKPQDLKGKRVAVTRNSTGEFFLYNYLIFNRLPTDSARMVYYTPSEMVKAMADGTIDAALSWPPYTTLMAKQLGANGMRWPAQSGQDYYLVLLAKERFLKNQPRVMEQFLAALLEAQEFIARHPDRAQTVLRAILKTDAETFLEDWSRSHFQVQLTQDMLVLMEREAKWAMRNKLVQAKEMPNYLDFIYFKALDNVQPEAVSIVH